MTTLEVFEFFWMFVVVAFHGLPEVGFGEALPAHGFVMSWSEVVNLAHRA
jgi:hypothetical protein